MTATDIALSTALFAGVCALIIRFGAWPIIKKAGAELRDFWKEKKDELTSRKNR